MADQEDQTADTNQDYDAGYDYNPEPTQAELQLQQEADAAKGQIDQINQYDNAEVEAAAAVVDVEDPKIQKFTVTNPMKVGGHIKYNLAGVNSSGEFSQVRRFKEFHALSETLKTRWPGCFVPSIPEKSMQKQGEEFVEERRQLLERFMKEIAKLDYLLECEEFAIFIKGSGEVDKALFSMPRQSPGQILEKYRAVFSVTEEADANALEGYKNTIVNFQQFLKKASQYMENGKAAIKSMIGVRSTQDKNQQTLIASLMKYEDVGTAFYSDQDFNKRLLTHPSAEGLKERVDESIDKFRNPYRDQYIWYKGELLDINSMYNGLLGRETITKALLQIEVKRRMDMAEQQKLQEGKKTLKSVFKSKSKKEQSIMDLQTAQDVADVQISDYKKLINFLTIYHGHVSIPKFMAAKTNLYLKTLNNFSVKEISNSHTAAILFHSMLEIGQK